MNLEKKINLSLKEHIKIFKLSQNKIISNLPKIISLIHSSLIKGNKLLWCGNGGSASDCMHLSAEFVGKFKDKRKSFNSISLTSDQAAITCIANDFGYKYIFSRQIEGIGKPNDILICMSTSGNSENIIEVLKISKKKKIKTILISGNRGGRCAKYSDIQVIIPSKTTSRIQEIMLFIGHLIIELVEKKFKVF